MLKILNVIALLSTLVLVCPSTVNAETPAARLSDLKFSAPGDFDYYVFEMVYDNDHCAELPDSSCLHSDHMKLHGLWPTVNGDADNNYSDCGFTSDPVGKLPWCDPSIDVKSAISPVLFGLLDGVMLNAKSCLYTHEWYTHGSCSGLDINSYFLLDTVMAIKFENLYFFNKLLKDSAGRTLTSLELTNAIAQDIGSEVLPAVAMKCRKDKVTGDNYFSAIDFALNKDKVLSFPAQTSFTHFQPVKLSTCPDAGIHILK